MKLTIPSLLLLTASTATALPSIITTYPRPDGKSSRFSPPSPVFKPSKFKVTPTQVTNLIHAASGTDSNGNNKIQASITYVGPAKDSHASSAPAKIPPLAPRPNAVPQVADPVRPGLAASHEWLQMVAKEPESLGELKSKPAAVLVKRSDGLYQRACRGSGCKTSSKLLQESAEEGQEVVG
jgi:hypothetical protein